MVGGATVRSADIPDEQGPINRVSLSGWVLRQPKRRMSPAGVAIWTLWLEHRSTLCEAGVARTVRAQVPVVATGTALAQICAQLFAGSQIRLHGFLAARSLRQPEDRVRLVVHATEIEVLRRPGATP